MHRVAEERLKPAREAVTGRFGLRATPGGFGTPPFGDVEEWHVEGTDLIVRCGAADIERTPIEDADPAAAEALAEWFAFGWGVLEELRAEAAAADLGPRRRSSGLSISTSGWTSPRPTTARRRATRSHDEPYLYVGPWEAPPEDPLWNAEGLRGRRDGVCGPAGRRRPGGGGARVLSQPRDALQSS